MTNKNLLKIVLVSLIAGSIVGGIAGYNIGKYLHEPIKIENMNVQKNSPQVIRIENRRSIDQEKWFYEQSDGSYKSD